MIQSNETYYLTYPGTFIKKRIVLSISAFVFNELSNQNLNLSYFMPCCAIHLGGKIKYFYTKCKTEKATLDFCIVWNFEAFYWKFSLSTNSEIRMIHIHFGLNVSTISKSRTMNVYCDFGLSFYCIMFDKKVSRVLIKPYYMS